MSRLFEAIQRATEGPASEPPTPVQGIDGFRSEPRTTQEHPPAGNPARQAAPPVAAAANLPDTVIEPTADVKRLHDPEWRAAFGEYRRMAAALLEIRNHREVHSVIVMSAVPGEGKSLTATNLALTLANLFKRSVLLVDADLARPRLHQAFGVPRGPGLAECLTQGHTDDRYLKRVTPNLVLLPAGSTKEEPSGLLSSPATRSFLAQWSTQYDWVVVDTPPAVSMPDAGLIATWADLAVLVVQAGKTRYDDVQQVIETVGADRFAGVVLNQLAHEATPDRYYQNYYSDAATPELP